MVAKKNELRALDSSNTADQKGRGEPIVARNVRVLKLTRRLADEYRKMPSIEGERPISGSRVKALKKSFSEVLRPFDWACAVIHDPITRNEIGRVRINGQTTSNIMCDIDIPEGAVVVLSEYWCYGKKDLIDVYSCFDLRASARSWYDILENIRKNNEHLAEASTTATRFAASGIAYDARGTAGWTPKDRKELVQTEEGVNFTLWYFLNVYPMVSMFTAFRRGPVIAAFMQMWRENENRAAEFAKLVGDQDVTLNGRHPARQLREKLIEGTGQKTGGVYFHVGKFEHESCLKFWKLWLKTEKDQLF